MMDQKLLPWQHLQVLVNRDDFQATVKLVYL
jgi:hypothetical protein